MKNYRITVNGTSYDVSVEELSGGAAPVAAPVAAAPVAAPAPAAAPALPFAAPARSGSRSKNKASAFCAGSRCAPAARQAHRRTR